MKTQEIVQKYQALSQVYHGAGGDGDVVAQAIYNAGYAALAEACGGTEILNAVTAAFAKGVDLPEEWPLNTLENEA